MSRAVTGIALLLLGVYLLTASGHLYAIDEVQMYGLAEAIGARGTLALNDPGPAEPPVYSTYGPGQSLAALPLFWLGSAAGGMLPGEARPWLQGAVTLWLNPLVTALTAALVYLGGRRLAGHLAALFAALVYGLGTMAWPHTRTFFAEPLNALLWLGAFLLLWQPPDGVVAAGAAFPKAARGFDQGPGTRDEAGPVGPWSLAFGRTRAGLQKPRLHAFALSGLLAGLAPAVKIQAVIALPILGLYAVLAARRAQRPWVALGGWGVGAALPLAALASYNTALFGGPLRTGYGASILSYFTAPFWEGFGGQIWGLRRGLIWASPLMLLAPLGLAALWRRDRAAALLCGAMALSQALFYATWYAWDGAGAWGPRFLNTVLPFLCLPLAALFGAPLGRTARLRTVAVVLAVLTVPVQVGAMGVNMNQLFHDPPPVSQVLAHLDLAAGRVLRSYERHLAPGRAVLLRGFAPSEGEGAALLPRWTLGEARVLVRPAGAPAILTVAVSSCFVPGGPTTPALRVGGEEVAAGPACPDRVYRLLLASRPSVVTIMSPAWRPADAGIAREGNLGIYLSGMAVEADGRGLPLVGDRLPADPVPLDPTELRQRLGDPRIAVWDVWWGYLPLTALPSRALWAISAVWGGLALGCITVGLWLLASARR